MLSLLLLFLARSRYSDLPVDLHKVQLMFLETQALSIGGGWSLLGAAS